MCRHKYPPLPNPENAHKFTWNFMVGVSNAKKVLVTSAVVLGSLGYKIAYGRNTISKRPLALKVVLLILICAVSLGKSLIVHCVLNFKSFLYIDLLYLALYDISAKINNKKQHSCAFDFS